MIRFKPDTWAEAFLRFFAMAAPSGNVYVEISAPDLRFAAIVFLAMTALVLRKRLAANPTPALVLLVLLLASVPPWLVTSGNGRYYIPMLLCAGPLAIGLIYLLPLTRWFRAFLAVGLLAVQTFVVAINPPWDSWAWLAWGEAPYFHVDLPPATAAASPTTYVTLTSISYSLIAPRFPASSRWINVTSVGMVGRDTTWVQEFLRASPGPIMLIVPSIQGEVDTNGKPKRAILEALDVLLRARRLALAGGACELLPSRGVAAITSMRNASTAPVEVAGFWICPLRYPVDVSEVPEKLASPTTEAAFIRLEQTCPRFFPPGSSKTVRINGGALRNYPESDMKIYVLDNGQVLYKFFRALNSVALGTVDDIVAGKNVMDCKNIRGRGGLPWDREI